MSADSFFKFYRDNFKPAYANLVALEVARPKQILIEEGNALSHLSQANNQKLSLSLREDNIRKAHNHIMRATLDLHKLVWASLREKLDTIVRKSKQASLSKYT